MLLLSLCGQCNIFRIDVVKIFSKHSTQNILDAHQVVLKLFKINLYLSKKLKIFQKVILFVVFKPGLIEAHSLKIRLSRKLPYYDECLHRNNKDRFRCWSKAAPQRKACFYPHFVRTFPSPQGRIKQTLQQKLQVYKLLCTSSLNSKILPQKEPEFK